MKTYQNTQKDLQSRATVEDIGKLENDFMSLEGKVSGELTGGRYDRHYFIALS